MPTEERGNIGNVKPTGWHTVRYAGIDGNYLYNRCHLIGFQLTAENANERNLITGTRYMNVQGMLPFENMIADYIKETNNHVLYRVTPIFEGNNLLASGVLMEAKSVEDNGKGIEFCVYCYNVQPGVTIDYKTGESKGPEYTGTTVKNEEKLVVLPTNENKEDESILNAKYVLNTNSKKVHLPNCSSVKDIKKENKSAYNGNIEDLNGYTPCGTCKPYVIENKTEESKEVVTPIVNKPLENNVQSENKVTYIGNKKSMKFHYPDCSSVSQMNENNKKEFYGSREEVINQGFSSCGNCHP